MTSVAVRKSSPVVVRPSEPVTTTGKINLSAYDLYFVGKPCTVLLVFQDPIQNQKPAERIKWALSQALVHYYPLTGRLHRSGAGAGEVHISCSGDLGVLFVAASANGAMEEEADQSVVTGALLDQLAVPYSGERCGDADPLLMIQVTEFSCGGFVVGVTWNHGVADGVGMGQFLQAVGELSRGLSSPSVPPVRQDESLAVTSSNVEAAVKHMYRTLERTDNALLDITIPSSLINRIKDGFRGSSNGRTCSVFEVICAVLWQCRTRAVMSDPKASTALYFPASARKYAGAKEGYYGNCITAQLVMAESGRVADGDLMDLVKMIQREKELIPAKFSKHKDCSVEQMPAPLGYNFLGVACWRKLGLESTNFGGGVPARLISPGQHRPGLPTCKITSTGEHGSRVMSCCVKDEHAQAFLAELLKIN